LNSFSKILMQQKIKITSSLQLIDSKTIMPNTPAKRKKVIGKLMDEAESCNVCLVHSAKLAKSTEVPLVVTPEAALYACASTASLKVTLNPLSSSTPSSNLSSAFAAKSLAVIMKSPSSVVKKKVEYIDFCDSTQVKTECFKYIKNGADLPIDQQSQIDFLVRKFNSSAIIAAFSMLIGKIGGAALMAFFPLPTMKEDLIQQFLCLIYDTKLMMINTKRSVIGMCDQNIHTLNILEYFVDYNFVNQNTHTLNIFGNRVV
jgi:hypothetical protein